MSRMQGIHWSGRLGGRIVEKPTQGTKKAHYFAETPDRLTDNALKKNVCDDGTKCKNCACLDKCRYGVEYLKRGLNEA